MRHYFKITTSREAEMTGAGLGYDEMFGDLNRYFWSDHEAQWALRAIRIDASADLRGTYSVQQRTVYDDGRYDDEGDSYAREQLGFPSRHPAGCSCGSPDCPEWQATMLGAE